MNTTTRNLLVNGIASIQKALERLEDGNNERVLEGNLLHLQARVVGTLANASREGLPPEGVLHIRWTGDSPGEMMTRRTIRKDAAKIVAGLHMTGEGQVEWSWE